jgi:hypothetical protein
MHSRKISTAPENEQQSQHDFSERYLVDSPEKFEAEPSSGNQER